jgi:tyrosyl-tRNA synthetase
MFPPLNEQMDIIRYGVMDLLPEDELEYKLKRSIKENKPLIIKLGCDPSRPDLHLGHAVVLYKMRQFQDLGHNAILIVGDFTGMIGDPSGKSKTRPQLSLEETRINGKSYLEQATKVLSEERLEVRYNSEWLSPMSFVDVINLSAKYTVAQILERDDFSKRFKSGEPISIHELLYPLAQAMDSAAINSDVELGGTDQKFNLLVGREIQKSFGKEPQCIITMPILEGTDGIEKMSKSLNNYIGINDSPREIFGRTMSIPDNLILRYYHYGARASQAEIEEMDKALKDNALNPRDAKVRTAMDIVKLYHSEEAAKEAFEEFERIFKNKDLPDEIEEKTLHLDNTEQFIVDILDASELAPSKKEAKRLIEQGGVYLEGERIADIKAKANFAEMKLLKVGKRKFLRVRIEHS